MIIEIATEGGFGGIAATPPKRIDLDRQSEELRQALASAFAPSALSRMQAATCPGCPDRLSYRITIIEGGQASRCVTLSESQIPPDTLDLLDGI
ncbi:protealysin inhibitor emfourin [Paracoccus beibuensis]|uniref:protealysin inhibitor emfourin n=1 Tax=Paracoccus beibuensis TaxID=547602 RepID=UPI00223F16A9|nr:protealysin inhibitor emfourin [Paracoccus beibuensis]